MHLLFSIRPFWRLSDLTMEIKKASTAFINDNKLIKGKFQWQESYGAFSYSRWDVEKICNYIANQKKHHQKKTFREEYLEFLEEFDIEFNEKYLFSWLDSKEEPITSQ